MALVGQETINKTYDKRNRGWRLTIDTPWAGNDNDKYKAAIRITNHREIILVDPADLSGEEFRKITNYEVVKKYSDIELGDAPVMNEDGSTQYVLPAAATAEDFGVYDTGSGYTVRLTGGLMFAMVAYFADVLGIAEAPAE